MAIQSLPYLTLIEIDRNSDTPVFRQVALGVIELIKSGKLRPGYQLPASREMALMLQLNRTTVVSAYEELQLQGWLVSQGRKGNFVPPTLPIINPKGFEPLRSAAVQVADRQHFYRKTAPILTEQRVLKPYQLMINDGYPDARIAPFDSIYEHYRFLAKKTSLHAKLLTESTAGSQSLRDELALFLSKTRALDISPSQVLVTHGAQLAISIAANMILEPGSTVIVADLNYILADKLFEQLGATLIKVKVDEQGIDVDEIENICKRTKPSLLYIIPHHHHPTTVTLSAERRIKLLDIIKRYGLPVIEDDYDYDFHYEHSPILPLASADHQGYVLYIGSISKTLSPTIRLGYLIAGEDFIWHAAKLKQLIEIRGDVLLEEAIAHLFHTGEMQRHLVKSVKLYRQRRDMFCTLLREHSGDIAQFEVPQGGMAVWTRFKEGYSIPALSERMATNGIYMNDGSLYRYKADVNGVRLGFASLNVQEMQDFIGALQASK